MDILQTIYRSVDSRLRSGLNTPAGATHFENATRSNAGARSYLDLQPEIQPPPLPAEIHLHILEQADFEDHFTLAKVCKLWRHFLKTSKTVRKNRYETYNSYYDGHLKANFEQCPKPRLHKIINQLETFVKCKDGIFRPGRIHLPVKSERWGGRWRHDESHPSKQWVQPRCKVLEPFDYNVCKDDPLVIYSEGDGPKPPVGTYKIMYRIGDMFSEHSEYFPLDPNVTVGDYLSEISRVNNLNFGNIPQSVGEHRLQCWPRKRSAHFPLRGNGWKDINVVWLSVYPIFNDRQYRLELAFVLRAIEYAIDQEN